jgi:hypothetical protein
MEAHTTSSKTFGWNRYHADLLVTEFFNKISFCINEGIHLTPKSDKTTYIDGRLNYLLNKLFTILNYSDIENHIHDLGKTLRNLAFVLKYFAFDHLVDKFFEDEVNKCNLTEDICLDLHTIRQHGMSYLFVQYYKKSVICPLLKQLLSEIDYSFTPEMEMHFKNGVSFVPCISLFKHCTDWPEKSTKQLKCSWLNLVFQIMGSLQKDFKTRLANMFINFREHYKYSTNASCRIDFFCTIFIPILDDINSINCLQNKYDVLLSIIYLVAAAIGNSMYIEKILRYESHESQHLQYLLRKYNEERQLLFYQCYELISLKPYTIQSTSLQPSTSLLTAIPKLYKYDKKNSPHRGILSQLFLYAAGAKIDLITKPDTIIVRAEEILSRLPPEWKNFKIIHDKNFKYFNNERMKYTFVDIAPSTYVQVENDIYFSILPNDAYMVLYYISRILSYYLQIKYFECEENLYKMYDVVLEETLRNPIQNSKDVAEEVILKLQQKIETVRKIPNVYNTPERKNVKFNFFSKIFRSGVKTIPFFQLENKNSKPKTIKHYGNYMLTSRRNTNNKDAIRLILYLSTVLNINNALNVKPFLDMTKYTHNTYISLLSEIKFIDKSFYAHLLYTLKPDRQGYNTLHHLLRFCTKQPIKLFGLGILRLLSIFKRPKNPYPLLLELIDTIFCDYIKEDDGMQLHVLMNKIFFSFKRLDMTKWFYPCLMGVSCAYGELSFLEYMKSCVSNKFDCDKSFFTVFKMSTLLQWRHIFVTEHCTVAHQNETLQTIGRNDALERFKNIVGDVILKENLNHNTSLRLCDLLYFITVLHQPIIYTNVGIRLPDNENGFEFYSFDFDSYKLNNLA